MEFWSGILNQVILLVASALVAFMFREISRYLASLRSKAESEEEAGLLGTFTSVLTYLIRGAEQYVENDGAIKKAWVFTRARDYADDLGLSLTDEQISDLIEGVFSELNSFFEDFNRPEEV